MATPPPPTALLRPSQALALLQRHCGMLRGRLAFDASRDQSAEVPQLWLVLVCTQVTASEVEAGLGYELRIAIDVVNSLCACRGFAPHRHPNFWREATSSLWIQYTADAPRTQLTSRGPYMVEPLPHAMRAFDAAAFSHFAVDVRATPDADSDSTLAELWRQVTWTDTSRSCPRRLVKSRDDALARLRCYAVEPVRTLALELLVLSNEEYSEQPPAIPPLQNWQQLATTLEEINANVETSSVQTVTLAIRQTKMHRFTLHSTNLLGVHRLMTGCAFIQCLHLDVALSVDTESALDRDAWFCELLRTLLIERKTLRALRLMHEWGQSRAIEAACSLLPVASSLQEFGCCITFYRDPPRVALAHVRTAASSAPPPRQRDNWTSLSRDQRLRVTRPFRFV